MNKETQQALNSPIRQYLVCIGIAITVWSIVFSTYTKVRIDQIGISFNPFSGSIDTLSSGRHFMSPFTLVSRIPTNPVKVCINGKNYSTNCKLLSFRKSEWRELIRLEGWRYYWWDNRLTISTIGQNRGFSNLLFTHYYLKSSFVNVEE